MDKLEQGEEVGRGSAESLFANYLQVFGCNFSFVGVSCNLNFHFHFYVQGSIRGHIFILQSRNVENINFLFKYLSKTLIQGLVAERRRAAEENQKESSGAI